MTPELRVAMVSEHASPLALRPGSTQDAGGQNVFVACLSEALAQQGAEVVVYTRRDDRTLPERVQMRPGVIVEHVDAGPPEPIFRDDLLPHMRSFGRRLQRAWRRERPHVVHAHHWMSGLAALAAAPGLGIPLFQTFHILGVVKRRHQGEKDTSPPERIDAETRIVREADRIVATCTDELFELVRMGADATRVDVIPAGVDLSAFTPHGPRFRRRRGVHRVVVISRLVERKGIGNVIEAIAQVPGCELIVAGGPDPEELDHDREAQRYRALAERLGVAGRVHLIGSVERKDVPALLRSADVVATVPWYEPFGMVAVEAMACGVPVVASQVGGLVDTVVDGVTGFHVPPRASCDLAERLRLLLARPALRRRLGAAGAERAQQRYGWDSVAAATLESYLRVLGQRRVVVEGRQRL